MLHWLLEICLANRIINLLMVVTAAIGIAYFLVPVLESGCEQIVQQKLVYELEKGIEDLKELQEELLAKFSRDNLTKQEATYPICPGSIANQLASSCQQILSCDISSSSGYYWIALADGNSTEMYCSMNRVRGGVSGGWMRVAELDTRNSGSQCPSGLREREHSGHKLCSKDIAGDFDGGCSQVFFRTNNFSYDQVCGKIIVYQFGTTDSFRKSQTIEHNYLDGISLTYGKKPRKHIWSFAAALNEAGTVQLPMHKPNHGIRCYFSPRFCWE